MVRCSLNTNSPAIGTCTADGSVLDWERMLTAFRDRERSMNPPPRRRTNPLPVLNWYKNASDPPPLLRQMRQVEGIFSWHAQTLHNKYPTLEH